MVALLSLLSASAVSFASETILSTTVPSYFTLQIEINGHGNVEVLGQEFTESGRTFVISTHIIEEAADLFEEVIFLHEGRILLKENTQELLEHSIYVSGRAEEVDEAVKGKEIHHQEILGRSKSVMVRLKEGETLNQTQGITLQPMNLQKVFVSLCAGEEE